MLECSIKLVFTNTFTEIKKRLVDCFELTTKGGEGVTR